MSIQEYSVSNRGLRSGLGGTPGEIQEQIGRFEEAGVDLLLLQLSPQLEEMEHFSDSVIRPLR
jgi:dimethylsulfone monooxygenase